MHRDTMKRIREAQQDPRPLDELIASARAAAPVDRPVAPFATLPTGLSVPLVTMTLHELHDLTYNAASTYLHRLPPMGRDRAREHAARIAAEAEQIARASDYVHAGTDPRG